MGKINLNNIKINVRDSSKKSVLRDLYGEGEEKSFFLVTADLSAFFFCCFLFFKTIAHEHRRYRAGKKVDKNTIKIPRRIFRAGIIVQFARIMRISRVFLP